MPLPSPFLNRFPTINYAISWDDDTQDTQSQTIGPKIYEAITDIFFRVGFRRNIIDYASLYQPYVIKDGETPEIISELYYGDPGYYWIILWANGILDPQYDWPLNNDAFTKYMIDKYGSLEAALTSVHHYARVIERTDNTTGIVTIEKDEVDAVTNDDFVANFPTTPYEAYDALADEGAYRTYEFPDGRSITEKIYREAVSVYDFENNSNEAKRNIKLIDKAYFQQIAQEFRDITVKASPSLVIGRRSARI